MNITYVCIRNACFMRLSWPKIIMLKLFGISDFVQICLSIGGI